MGAASRSLDEVAGQLASGLGPLPSEGEAR
jgi:hypothetical protein